MASFVDEAGVLEGIAVNRGVHQRFRDHSAHRPQRARRMDGRSYEMATRLSYLFLGSMPDQTLRDEAAADRLQTPAQVQAQAERLLKDSRTRQTFKAFHDQWLDLERAASIDRDAKIYPGYTDAIPNLLQQVAGGAGHFRMGRCLKFNYADTVPHNQMLLSFINAMGIEDTTFGNPEWCTGPLPGMT